MIGHWITKRLCEVCELINGRAYSKPELLGEGKYPVLRVGNFFTSDHWYYSDLELEPKKYCDTGDLLYAWSASFGPRIWTGGKVIFHYHIWKIVHDSSQIDKKFLYHFLNWDTEQIKADQGAGTTMIHVSKGSMENREIPLPPLPEQRRIVAILDEAFTAIDTAKANTQQNLKNARALFDAHLQSVFSGIQAKYPIQPLIKLCERITKGSSPKWQGMKYVNRPGVLFVTSENVRENQINVDIPKFVEESFNKKEKRSILNCGDVLTNLVGASIGRTAVYDRTDVANINQAVGLIRCNANELRNFYLMYFLNSPSMRDFFHSNEVNGARANISLTFVSELKVPVPPIKTQDEVVDQINKFREATYRLESIYQQKLDALETLKKSLLHDAFRGKLTTSNKQLTTAT